MPFFAIFQNFGGPELIVVLVVILILFGPKKLPALSRAIGKSIGEFKKGRQELDDEINAATDVDVEEKKKEEASSPPPVNTQ